MTVIKKRIVKCEWQNVLMIYNSSRYNYDVIEVLASHDTRDEAIENQSKFFDRLNGTNYTLSVDYHEVVLSEEVLEPYCKGCHSVGMIHCSDPIHCKSIKDNTQLARALYIKSEAWFGHKRDSKDFDDLSDMTWHYWYELAKVALEQIDK